MLSKMASLGVKGVKGMPCRLFICLGINQHWRKEEKNVLCIFSLCKTLYLTLLEFNSSTVFKFILKLKNAKNWHTEKKVRNLELA